MKKLTKLVKQCPRCKRQHYSFGTLCLACKSADNKKGARRKAKRIQALNSGGRED